MMQVTVQYGGKQDIPELKKLWKACFDDEDAYIDAFFAAMYADKNVLLVQEKGMLAGASFFLPGRIFLDGQWQDIRYVYALAVYKQYRGQNMAHHLLHEAYKVFGVPFLTEPADQGLAERFYEPYGFSNSFYLNYDNISLQKAQEMSQQGHWTRQAQICPANAQDYYLLREERFFGQGYVSWPKNHIAFAMKEHRANGGDALIITGMGRNELILYFTEGTRVTVTETTLSVQDTAVLFADRRIPYEKNGQAYEWLEIKSGTKQVERPLLSAMELRPKEENHFQQLLGMSYGINLAQGYLNLTLD